MDSFKKNKLGITPLEKRVMLDASLPAIAGQVLWLDAADATTVIDADGDNAATGTGGSNNGFAGTVATWRDKSGYTNDVSQATAANRPTYNATTLNSKPVLGFDGTNDSLFRPDTSASLDITGNGLTIFAVVRGNSVANSMIINKEFSYELALQGSAIQAAVETVAGGSWAWGGTTAIDTSWRMVDFQHNNTLWNFFKDGALTQTIAPAGGQTGNIIQSARIFTVGARDINSDNIPDTQFFNGQMAEILVYNQALTSDHINDIENYLASKWGLSITNTSPTSSVNTGTTLNEGATTMVVNTMLAYTDTDNTDTTLIYTITDAIDYGTLTNTNTATALILGSTFTQSDIDNGYITYTHDGSETTTDSFQFTVTDQLGVAAGATFAFTINPINDSPAIATNTVPTILEGGALTITNAMLNEGDPDDSGTGLTYTASSLTNGHIEVNNVTQSTFTQADIDAGLVEFVHDGSETLSASFAFSLADGGEDGATPATGTFSLSVTPQNDAPIIGGATLVTSENLESGASGWSNNTTTAGGSIATAFLGRHSMEAGAQNVHKTYTLSGNQEYVTISFDMYEIDSWDGENFIVYVDNLAAITIPLTQGAYNSPASGTNGAVSWVVQKTTPFNGSFLFSSGWNDQTYHFDLRVSTIGSSVKLGFSSTLDQAITDEAWGVDNIVIKEIDDGGVPGPFYVSEISPNTTVIGTITATDPDPADTRTFSISGGTGVGVFSINPATGVITVTNAAALDYETTTSYTLDVVVTDAGGLTDTETITINVIDVPENTAPVLTAIGPLSVAENALVGTALGTMTSTDAEGHAVTYSITAGNTDNLFSINATTGAITLSSTTLLNYERATTYTLTIRGTDNGPGTLSSTRNVIINVTNINEAPSFDDIQQILNSNPNIAYNATTGNFYQYISTAANYATATANANAAQLAGIGGYLATSTSATENTYIRSLISNIIWLGGSDAGVEGNWLWDGGPDAGMQFWLGAAAGSAQNGYYTAWSAGEPNDFGGQDYLRMLNTTGLWDDVGGASTYGYVIEWTGATVLAAVANGPYTINENVAAGTSVGFAHADDPDVADTLTYSITGGTGMGSFAINGSTGEITLTNAAAANYELASSYTLDLLVQDAGGLTDTVTVTINITNINDVPTAINMTGTSVTENAAANTVVATLSTVDEDVANTHTYSLTSNPGNFFKIVGNQLQVNRTIDFEATPTITLTIRTNDGNGGTYNRTVTINVSDVNESPSFDSIQRVLNANPGVLYSATTGNFYKIVTTGANLATATTNAAAMTINGVAGYIATSTSAAENAFLATMVSSNTWIGGSDAAVEGEWRWMGGPDAGQMFWLGAAAGSAQNGYYTNWGGGEPNNSGGNEDGIQMYAGGGWNDLNVANVLPYLVEWTGANVLAAQSANGPYTINENVALGTSVGFANARDPDAGDVISYSITGGTGAATFAINSATGEITTIGALNYESVTSYTLDLRVQDVAGLFDTATITININDINDVPTDIALSYNRVTENEPIGTLIGLLSTTDEDPADTHTYSFVSNPYGLFGIVGNQIQTIGAIDYEAHQNITVVIRTDDGNGGTYDESFVIYVNDVMDTFVAPPPPPPAVSPPPSAPTYQPLGESSAELIKSTVFGGEEGQTGAFYGFGKFFQILRDNTTFQIRRLTDTMGDDLLTDDSRNAGVDAAPVAEDVAFTDHYTNIRQALEFLNAVDAAQDSADAKAADAAPAPEASDAFVPIDMQFVDVMTYHEQKQQHLRKALLGQ